MTASQTKNRPIDLLAGFDAMRLFLQARWEEDEKQSDDLANFLSNISRDIWANGQPLDIAQWSDWLDAVLSVRRDLDDVERVRQEIQDDYLEFLKAREIKPSEARRKALDELRAKAAHQTWHRIGHRSISALDAYESMRAFISAYWNRGGKQSRDIGNVLEELRHEEAAPQIAQWDAWLSAIDAARMLTNRPN